MSLKITLEVDVCGWDMSPLRAMVGGGVMID